MGVITVSDLGTIGRVGNQLFLYAFAKGYALHHGCELQIPADWWGRKVFVNATEPPVTKHLLKTHREQVATSRLGYFFGQKNIDISVYAQHQVYLEFYTRAQVRDWFKIQPWLEKMWPALEGYTAIHLRRGDYATHPLFRKRYCLVSDVSYQQAIRKFRIPGPVITIGEGLAPPLPNAFPFAALGVPWLLDFLTLRNAAHLLRANSSFSLWAGWLGQGKVYSPVVGDKIGWNDVEFVEGNHSNTAGFFKTQSDLRLREL